MNLPSNGCPKVTTDVLSAIWETLIQEFFPTRGDLNAYAVIWSERRQKRVLASCHIEKQVVRVARELNRPEYFVYLEPLLYHELCHAVIGRGVEQSGRAKQWHGPQFKDLESRHPQTNTLKEWIKDGGWHRAVRRDRAIEAARKRRL